VEHKEVPAKNLFYKEVISVAQTVFDILPFEFLRVNIVTPNFRVGFVFSAPKLEHNTVTSRDYVHKKCLPPSSNRFGDINDLLKKLPPIVAKWLKPEGVKWSIINVPIRTISSKHVRTLAPVISEVCALKVSRKLIENRRPTRSLGGRLQDFPGVGFV